MKWVAGRKNPVTLVARVVTKKVAVQPFNRFAASIPNRTTNPENIPTKLNNTCTKIKVPIVYSMISP